MIFALRVESEAKSGNNGFKRSEILNGTIHRLNLNVFLSFDWQHNIQVLKKAKSLKLCKLGSGNSKVFSTFTGKVEFLAQDLWDPIT